MDAGEGSRAVVVLVAGDVELVVGRLAGVRPDLALVDALARLQLAARRLGWSIRLCGPDARLCELLDLAGLTDVVRVAGSPLQAGWEAEGGEQLGVEEVVDGGDPLA